MDTDDDVERVLPEDVLRLAAPEGLADETLEAVPIVGLADLARDGDAKTRDRRAAAEDEQREARAGSADPLLEQARVESRAGEARRPPEGGVVLPRRDRQSARRLRPLERRRRSTARPPRLFIRTRKPWVRRRWRLFGW